MQVEQPTSVDFDQVSPSRISYTPFLFAASGLLMVAAALLRFFRPSATPEYSMLVATAEQYRVQREMREKQRAEQVQREIQERLLRLASMGAHVSQSSTGHGTSTQPSSAAGVGTVNEWEVRQQARERMEREKAEAKQREIQERLARLSKLSSTATQAPQAAATSPLGEVSEWELRQQQRERREREVAEAKQREIQERLARLASMGALSSQPQAAPSTSTPLAADSANDWERRQQQREQREREIAEAKQREIQERLARLAKLGAAPAPSAPVASTPVINDWEKRQQERARKENEKAASARREIEERMARLARLSSGH